MQRKLYAAVVTGLVAVMMLFSVTCSSDSKSPDPPVSSGRALDHTDNTIRVDYDTPPGPVDGFAALQKELVYPESAKKNKIEGRVILQTVIDETGEILEVDVIKSLDPACDEAAAQAIRATEWKPALEEGKPVKVKVAVPVVFKLQ